MKKHLIQILSGVEPPPERFSEQAPVEENPDARIIARNGSGEVIAHAALWWNDVPPFGNELPGAIGGFAADDEEAAHGVLQAAEDHLRLQGRTIAVGPMNGNTWRRYRFAEAPETRPPFLLEPSNPPEYPRWWRGAGFAELSSYSSSAMPLDGSEAVPPALRERLLRSGILIRPLDPERYEDELRLIHQVSLKSFASNFLYTPLAEDAFLRSYVKVKAHVDRDLVLIAEKNGEPCGFVFGIPDLAAAMRGERPALIVKTLAVDPGSRSAGLGSLLVDELHRAGARKGYAEAIHALQHENNTSLKITGRHEGRVFRRYVLFSKPL
jgi:predicted N-acetyltransferase YhbS